MVANPVDLSNRFRRRRKKLDSVQMNTSIKTILPLFLTILTFCGCQTNKSEKAPHSTVGGYTGMNAAMAVNNNQKGRVTGRGTGDSMAPLLGDNTLIVTHPIKWEDLKPGMIVVYRDSRGKNITHKLSHQEKLHWVAVGINNEYVDEERVTPHNLVGVVYATFHTEQVGGTSAQ